METNLHMDYEITKFIIFLTEPFYLEMGILKSSCLIKSKLIYLYVQLNTYLVKKNNNIFE